MKYMIIPILLLATVLVVPLLHQNTDPMPMAQVSQTSPITKNGMTVSWRFANDSIYITTTAPTTGWVTVGINTNKNLTGAYLLMGRIVKNKAEVVEHHTLVPGNYHPLKKLGATPLVKVVSGHETHNSTTLTYAIPCSAKGRYRHQLQQGMAYYMVMAYSRDDDFKHHSTMRTSLPITL